MFQYMEIVEGKVIVQSCGHMQIKFWLIIFFALAIWDVHSFYFSFQWIFILMAITK